MNQQSLNVDPREIRKFEELASRWWDRNSEFKPLHEINPLRANFIDQHSPVAGKTLIDVGCGGGSCRKGYSGCTCINSKYIVYPRYT